jgi:putative spermidine/putrescine transport system substrate-binding protein
MKSIVGLQVMISATLALCLSCTVALAADDTLRIVHYGGSPAKAMRDFCFNPAEKALGFKTVDMSRTDIAKIKAMVESHNIEWDVALINTLEVIRGAKENLWEKIDYKLIDPKVNGPVKPLDYSVTYLIYSQGLAYSTEKYPDPSKAPRNWTDFWDVKKFPGPRAMENRVRYELEAALMADGVPPDKLYPLDVERAFRKLDEIKPYITVWSNPPVQALDLIANGDIVMGMSSAHEVASAREKGVPVEFAWPQSLYITNDWAVLKGTPHREEAMKFIKFCTSAEPEVKMAETLGFGPPNPQAVALLSPKVRRTLPTAPENLRDAAAFDAEWWGENEAKLIERWNAWLLKK